MAVVEFKLPELGEGIHEGEVVKWHIKEGDRVEEDQVIVDIQNDKAVVEVPSPFQGTVKELVVQEGTISTVGETLVRIETDQTQQTEQAEPIDATEASLPTIAEQTRESAKQHGREFQQDDKANESTKELQSPQILATPSVRKLARNLAVDLGKITPTGANGRLTRQDIEQFVQKQNAKHANDYTAPEKVEMHRERERIPELKKKQEQRDTDREREGNIPLAGLEQAGTESLVERIPIKGIRKVIAQAMVTSKYTAPHVTIMDEVQATKLVALRAKAKPIAASRGIKLTYLPFIIKAVIAGLRQFPLLNASVDEETNEIIVKHVYHVGIATDTERGLLVPVVFHANQKPMWELALEIQELATKGREGKLSPEQLRGSTFTISNIGSTGGMFFTPIINYPEVAILGVGRLADKPVIVAGQVEIAPVLALSLSFDHRIIDGATAQQFLNTVKRLIEDPQLLVMEV